MKIRTRRLAPLALAAALALGTAACDSAGTVDDGTGEVGTTDDGLDTTDDGLGGTDDGMEDDAGTTTEE